MPDGHFAAAREALTEQQDTDVHRSDQQQAQRRPENGEQRRPHRAGVVLLQ